MGAAIASVVSLATMALFYGAFAENKPLGALGLRGLALFAVSGFMNFLSYVFIYTALAWNGYRSSRRW